MPTYIGWLVLAVTDTDAASVGLGGAARRRFLSDFYAYPRELHQTGVFALVAW